MIRRTWLLIFVLVLIFAAGVFVGFDVLAPQPPHVWHAYFLDPDGCALCGP